MASIRKLPNNKGWQATISCGRDTKGKQIRKYLTRNKEKDCISAARKIEIEVEENRLLAVPNMRFSAWTDKWLDIKEPDISPSTYVSYHMYIKTHFKPYFGTLKLDQINSIHIKQYISNKQKTKLSNNTIRKHFFVLNDIFRTAMQNKSPMIGIKPPEYKKPLHRLVTTKEFEIISASFKGEWIEIPLLLSGWCGLREGEIFALKWNDINWKNSVVRIDENMAISKKGYKAKDPKSEKGKRSIELPPYLLELLKERRKQELKSDSNLKDKQIFNMRPDSFSSLWGDLINDRELPDIRFHDLRHYHAYILYKADVPDQYAAIRMGHDIRVLKGIYQYLNIEDNREIEKNVTKMFKEPT